jgi:hypothetical protein
MPTQLINKLLESFNDLERCIVLTEDVLKEREGVPADIMDRVRQYAEIVQKQRGLALTLQDYISRQDWDEVSRIVRIINAMSQMIREDAQAILAGVYRVEDTEARDRVLS